MLAGLILAGGEGKRWGGPKAWAELDDGRTFLEACHDTLTGAGADPVLATLPPGAKDPAIGGLEISVLPEPGMDMFGSLRAGLSRLVESSDWRVVAVLPVDHPLVLPNSVVTLAAAVHLAAVPSFRGKHGHPVCIARELAESIVEGRRSGPTLREVLRDAGAVDVRVDDPGVVANCNTPDALAAALKNVQRSNVQR